MDILAPWAEPVLMTAKELLHLPDDEWRYELVEGRRVRMSPIGGRHGRIVMALLPALHRFVDKNHLGEIFPPETGFWISPESEPDTVLPPDLAFVSLAQAVDSEVEGYPRLAPDLVVEVASPSQGQKQMGAKARRWLDAGTRLVWIVLPETRTVQVWHPVGPVRILTDESELNGGDILPGFAYPVARLFS